MSAKGCTLALKKTRLIMSNIVKLPQKSKPDDDDREALRDALAIAKALGIKLPRKNIVHLFRSKRVKRAGRVPA